MLIKEFQLGKIFQEKRNFLSLMLFGPNEGLIREYIDKITGDYLDDDKYELVSFSGKDLDQDPQSLHDILQSVSMFFKNKIVIVDLLKDKHFKIIEEIISNPPQQVILLLKFDTLPKSSKFRKFFESEKTCFALACYDDDGRSQMQNIEKFIKENNLDLNQDTKYYLLQTLSIDRMVSKHELEKIKLYYKDESKKIELEDLKNLLNDSSSVNLSKMNEVVMNGNTLKSSIIINKLLSEGTNPISLIRSLMNYIMRIQMTKIEMRKGNDFENAIKILRPPVFWKDKDNFQKHCLKWPIEQIEKILNGLTSTEIDCKLNSKLAKTNCENSLLLIAYRGKKYFRY
tara:strand:+ start:8457 stop:9482 length:1026 start_codon:yes stop_codon:yes gene_type:complete